MTGIRTFADPEGASWITVSALLRENTLTVSSSLLDTPDPTLDTLLFPSELLSAFRSKNRWTLKNEDPLVAVSENRD